jgi:transcriptional regulator with XRE-family HTH domain
MKVDGEAVMKARSKIRANYPGRGEQGMPAVGTQEWLAEQANVSLRAVQYIERGQGSLETLRKVSQALGIKQWQTLIINYGQDFVSCSAYREIDFRPALDPRVENNFIDSPLMVSLDPLSLTIASGKFQSIILKEITLALCGLDQPILYSWLAEVLLTPAGKGWLGWEKDLHEMYLTANDQILTIPIMFKQIAVPVVSWRAFIDRVEYLKSSQLNLEVSLIFQNFTKHFTVYISVDLLKIIFQMGRAKYNSPYPYRAQLKAII